ncbi:MAG: class I SAM-dependent methyltransferase [bacterium]|nr:class I SAM-dependent methyltransferase [bacterium]
MALGADPLPPPEHKAAHVRAMFDRIAPRYDRLNAVLTWGLDRGWRRRALAAAAVRRGATSGRRRLRTGDLRRARAAVSGARSVGATFQLACWPAPAPAACAALVRGDAARLPLATGVAAAVTCGFALRNFAAIPPVLAEAARVLRPGGRLVVLEVATPPHALPRLVHRLYFDRLVPWIGALLAERAAYAYLPRSAAYLPPPPTLRHLVRDAGFVGVTVESLGFGAVQLLRAVRADA